jgi:hypothetical protein
MREVTLRKPLFVGPGEVVSRTRYRIGPDFACSGTPQPWAAVVLDGGKAIDIEVIGDFSEHPSHDGGAMKSGRHPWHAVNGVAMVGRNSEVNGLVVDRIPGAGIMLAVCRGARFKHATISRVFNGIFGQHRGQVTPPRDAELNIEPTDVQGSDFTIRDLWGWRLTDAQMKESNLGREYPAGKSFYRRGGVVGNDGLVGNFQGGSVFERFTIAGEMKAGVKFVASDLICRDFLVAHVMNQGSWYQKPHPDGDPNHYAYWAPVSWQPSNVILQDGTIDPWISSRGSYGDTLWGQAHQNNCLQASYPGTTRCENVTFVMPPMGFQPWSPTKAVQQYNAWNVWIHRVKTSGCRLVTREPLSGPEPSVRISKPEQLGFLEPEPGGGRPILPWGAASIEHTGLERFVQVER